MVLHSPTAIDRVECLDLQALNLSGSYLEKPCITPPNLHYALTTAYLYLSVNTTLLPLHLAFTASVSAHQTAHLKGPLAIYFLSCFIMCFAKLGGKVKKKY